MVMLVYKSDNFWKKRNKQINKNKNKHSFVNVQPVICREVDIHPNLHYMGIDSR